MSTDYGQIASGVESRIQLGEYRLPPGLRLLAIGAKEPSWVRLALTLDAADCVEARFDFTDCPQTALSRLRDEGVDGVLLLADSRESDFDALSVLRGLRAGGQLEPIILIADQFADSDWAVACECDCEVVITPLGCDSAALVPVLQRAMERAELSRRLHTLKLQQNRRVARERDEAAALLAQQREMIEQFAKNDSLATDRNAPSEFVDYYQQLLRTYVIMGSGNLSGEIERLAQAMAEAQLTPIEAMELHLERVEAVVSGLGKRSTRHIMSRADHLALELMLHIAECYRQKTMESRISS